MKCERLSEEESLALIYEVGRSHLPVSQSLMLLGIPRSTYHNWLKRGDAKLRPVVPANRLTEVEIERVIEHAHDMPDMSARELEWYITNHTTRVNEMWATDFTYVKVIDWGRYYIAGFSMTSAATWSAGRRRAMQGGHHKPPLQAVNAVRFDFRS